MNMVRGVGWTPREGGRPVKIRAGTSTSQRQCDCSHADEREATYSACAKRRVGRGPLLGHYPSSSRLPTLGSIWAEDAFLFFRPVKDVATAATGYISGGHR